MTNTCQAGSCRSAQLISYTTALSSLAPGQHCWRLRQNKWDAALARARARSQTRQTKQHGGYVSFRRAEETGSAQCSVRSPLLYLPLQGVPSSSDSAVTPEQSRAPGGCGHARALRDVLVFASPQHSTTAWECPTANTRPGGERTAVCCCAASSTTESCLNIYFLTAALINTTGTQENLRINASAQTFWFLLQLQMKDLNETLRNAPASRTTKPFICQALLTGPPYKAGRLLWHWAHLLILLRGVLSLCYRMWIFLCSAVLSYRN